MRGVQFPSSSKSGFILFSKYDQHLNLKSNIVNIVKHCATYMATAEGGGGGAAAAGETQSITCSNNSVHPVEPKEKCSHFSLNVYSNIIIYRMLSIKKETTKQFLDRRFRHAIDSPCQ